MNTKRVVHINEETGGIIIGIPTDEALEKLSIEELAPLIVPEGKPYKIIDVSDLPPDREFRNAWEIDESELTDGIGSPHRSFSDIGR